MLLRLRALGKRSQPQVGSAEFSKMDLAIGWRVLQLVLSSVPHSKMDSIGGRKTVADHYLV